MRTLYLHIGDSKTGSSSIQSSLYLSRASLAERHGLRYPAGRQLGTDPSAITSGNAEGLLASPDAFERGLRALSEDRSVPTSGTDRGVVYSSEFMFVELLDAAGVDFVPRLARAHGFERVEVLVFIRNPIAQATSVWQQSVKRGGSTGSLDELLATFEAPCRVERVVRRVEAMADTGLTILNYSAVGERLLATVAAWLGIEPTELVDPPIRINRSLSDGELVVQRALNAELGRAARVLADALCEQLPDVEPARPAPSEAAQLELWERVRPCAERVNERLRAEHRYRFDRVPPSSPDLRLSSAQLEVIGATLGRAVRVASRPHGAGGRTSGGEVLASDDGGFAASGGVRLVLHIGPHETATSLLQAAFAGSAEGLAEGGVVYATAGRHGDGHHELAWASFDGGHAHPALAEDRPRATWDDVAAELGSLGAAERLLLSSEEFCFFRDHELAALAEVVAGLQVELLVGVRDPAATIPSTWQESVKWGEQRSLEDAFPALSRDPEIELLPLIDRWRRHLPQARVRAFVVPAGGSRTDVLRAAAAALGVPLDALAGAATAPGDGDTSLPWVHVEALRAISVALDPAGGRDTLQRRREVLRPLASVDPGGRPDRPRLGPEQLDRARAVRRSLLAGLADRHIELAGELPALPTPEDPGHPVPPGPAEVIGALRSMRRQLPADHEARRVIDAAIDAMGPSGMVRVVVLSERLGATARGRLRALRSAGRG